MEEEDRKMISIKHDHFINDFLYFASNFFWIIFLVPIYLYFRCISRYQEVPLIESYNGTENWNPSYNPHIFGFLSDPHITAYFPNNIKNFESVLKIFNETGVERIMIGGDISDNFGTSGQIKHGHQYENDFVNYRKIVSKYDSDLFIVASGNHDEFGVENYNSSDHYILKYCDFYKNEKYEKYENFLISNVEYDDIEIFVMNLYHYPTVRAGLGYYSNLTRGMLDRIESTLLLNSKAKIRFVISHFPLAYSNTWSKSSSGKNLIDIITSSNINAVFVGHSHHELVLHQKKTIEIRPFSVEPGKNRDGGYHFISIDNGGLNDHGFILGKEKPVAVLTYPVQKKYINDKTDFSIKNFNEAEIRVVHFSENSKLNISVSCSFSDRKNGGKNGFLRFQRIIRRNHSLYSIPLNEVCKNDKFSNKVNEYKLTFSGDWNYEAEFACGNQIKLKKEILDYDINMRNFIVTIGTVCWIISLYIWCPFPSFKYFDNLSESLANKKIPKMINELSLFDKLMCIFFGFFLVKSRIYTNINFAIRVIYFILILSPLFLPISLMKIGKNSYGFIYFLGYYLDSFAFDVWGGQLASYFIIFIIMPSTIVFSALSFFNQIQKWKFIFIIDIILACVQFVMILIPILRALYQSTSFLFAFTSPVFIFVPAVIISMEILTLLKFYKSIYSHRKNNDSEKIPYEYF